MTSKQLEQFKRVFRSWQKRFGLLEYTVVFEQKPLPNCWAQFSIDVEGCCGVLTLNRSGKWAVKDVKKVAAHECVHLLLARLTHLGHARFLTEDEIHSENERVTCVLEGVLWRK